MFLDVSDSLIPFGLHDHTLDTSELVSVKVQKCFHTLVYSGSNQLFVNLQYFPVFWCFVK